MTNATAGMKHADAQALLAQTIRNASRIRTNCHPKTTAGPIFGRQMLGAMLAVAAGKQQGTFPMTVIDSAGHINLQVNMWRGSDMRIGERMTRRGKTKAAMERCIAAAKGGSHVAFVTRDRDSVDTPNA